MGCLDWFSPECECKATNPHSSPTSKAFRSGEPGKARFQEVQLDALFVAYLDLLTVRVEIRMPREIVTVQLGQCGNQSNTSFFSRRVAY